MLGKRKSDRTVTLIAPGTEIVGSVHFGDQLYVNGVVRGDLFANDDQEATVVVSATGRVTGDIRVPNVVISGHVEGNVHAGRRVELSAGARVRGNVYYRLMEMELGAMVEGQLLHDDGAGAPSGRAGGTEGHSASTPADASARA